MPRLVKHLHNQKRLEPLRRDLRNNATPAEAALWKMLQRSQLGGRKFRRQHSVGPYVLDFYCSAEKLAVELDGAVHNDHFRAEYDAEREAYLTAQGINVVRFENQDVFRNPEFVIQTIVAHFRR